MKCAFQGATILKTWAGGQTDLPDGTTVSGVSGTLPNGVKIATVKVDPKPAYDPETQRLSATGTYLDGETPKHGWKVNALSPEAIASVQEQRVAGVKAEANRRILDIVPEWKQRNLIAQASILGMQVASGTPMSAEQQIEWDAGNAVWAQVAAIRAASDALEALPSIPADYTDDTHWP